MAEKSSSITRESSLRRKKTNSVYHYRRRSKALFTDQYHGELKHVLGFTLKSNCAFASDPNTGLLAYPAGCVVVLYNPRQEKQSHIFNPGLKNITCLRFSSDGNFIVTGEAGHQPCVRVFSVLDRCQVISFLSHKFGISCVAFSPKGKYVISMGYQHDNVINVWDWKKDKLAASNKVSTKIKSVAFSEDGSYFVTVGNRHVKFWYLENSPTDKVTVPLKGRSAILESLRNHVFCDVLCGVGGESKFTFAVTRSGMLCQFNAGRTVEKHVELSCGTARSICIIGEMILCGCSTGSVHVYNSRTLEFISEIFPPNPVRGFEVVAITIDMGNMWMHCVFSNHSLLVFDVMDFSSPNVHSSFQFHSARVWDVKVIPSTNEFISALKDCFLTCSKDGTTRAWRIEENKCKLMNVIKLDQFSEEENVESTLKYEARSLCVRHDGKHLAIGDQTGNIHVYNLETYEKIAFIPVHEGDILCMDYSKTGDILASASRGRCVHTFDSNYVPTHTIADHSAAVTSVKFAHHDADFRLVTCGSDKSLYFCAITGTGGKTEVSREQHFVEKHSMTDMAVLDDSVLVACGNNISEYEIIGGKLRRSFKGNESSVTILRVAVNNQKTIVATSCADKHIYVLNFSTTECLCVLSGHSEISTALSFDHENRLLSASSDSCVFVWVLTHRTIDDARYFHPSPNNNQASSALSTPDSPDMDKTAYFAEPLSEKLTIAVESHENTPRSLNGEVLPTLFDQSEPADDKDETLVAEASEASSTLVESHNLPTWVIKNLHTTDCEPPTNQTSKPDLGKWGNESELRKVCEEIGHLAQQSDVSSLRSSFDEELEERLKIEEDIKSNEEDDFHELPTTTVILPASPPSVCKSTTDDDSDSTIQQLIIYNDSLMDKKDRADIAETKNLPTDSGEVAAQEPPIDSKSVLDAGSVSLIEDAISKEGSTVSEDANAEKTFVFNTDTTKFLSEKYLPQEEISVQRNAKEGNSSLNEELVKVANTNSVPDLSPTELTVKHTDDSLDMNKTYAVSATMHLAELKISKVDKISVVNEISTVEEVSNLSNKEENAVDPAACNTTPVDEDVDIRNVVYLQVKQNAPMLKNQTFIKGSVNSYQTICEETEHDTTPKSHFTSTLPSRVIFPTFSSKLVSESSNAPISVNSQSDVKETNEEGAAIVQAVNLASRDLVENVLTSVEESSDVSSSNEVSSDVSSLPNGTTKYSISNESFAENDVIVDKNTGSDPVVSDIESKQVHDTELYDVKEDESIKPRVKVQLIATSSITAIPGSDQNLSVDRHIAPDTLTNSNHKPLSQRTPKSIVNRNGIDKASNMPPAFAELLASLGKKHATKLHPTPPPKTLSVKKTYQSCDDNSAQQEEPSHENINLLQEKHDSTVCNGMERFSCDETSDHSVNNNDPKFSAASRDDQEECSVAGEDLLTVFNRAEEIYHKQKAYHHRNEDDVSNGTHAGFNKLVRSLQTIYNRIGRLKITNSVHPSEEASVARSVSLDNLSDDSPVYSLLREYSDKLVDLVQTQTETKNVVTTAADVV